MWSCLSIAAQGVSLMWVLALYRARLASLAALNSLCTLDLLGLLLALLDALALGG